MTWLEGTSTWGNLCYDLARLATGEATASGNGARVAADDRWAKTQTRTVTDAVTTTGSATVTSATAAFTAEDVLSYLTAPGVPPGTVITAITSATTAVLSAQATATASGVAAQIHTDTIATNARFDIPSGDMVNGSGYFTNAGVNGVNNATHLAQTTASTVMRVSAPYTAALGGMTRWLMRFTVTAANTVAHNYSTASLNWYSYNLDTGATFNSNIPVTLTAAGVGTISDGLKITVSSPSGFLGPNEILFRAFSTTYLGGVDWWPMWHRASGPATFTTPPPGVRGTDWDISTIPTAFTPGGMYERGSLLYGLGIKTATALTGDKYTVSFPIAQGKCRVFPSATTGVLSIDLGDSRKDPASAAFKMAGGYRVTNWAKMFTTPASVTPQSVVQYQLSVTGDGIVAVLTGDPAVTGKMGTSYYCAFTPVDPLDVFPMVFNGNIVDYTTDAAVDNACGLQFNLVPLRNRQKGGELAVRDWQTGWMRGEHVNSASMDSGSATSDFPGGAGGVWPGNNPGQTYSSLTTPMRQAKPGPGGKWWLYPVSLAEGNFMDNNASDYRTYRGIQDRICFVPEDGWGHGDELTDTVGGGKWLLIKPDYNGGGAGQRIRYNTNQFWGGAAIRKA